MEHYSGQEIYEIFQESHKNWFQDATRQEQLMEDYSKNEENINLKVINFLRNNIANKKAKAISLKEREYDFI